MNKTQRKSIKEKVLVAFNQYISKSKKDLEFPVPIKAISKSFEYIRVIPYSRVMHDENINYATMIKRTGSLDAFTDYRCSAQTYIIYYNDLDPTITSSNRYRWNIAHELGHVLLNHHKRIKRTKLNRIGISDEEYGVFEEEADYFASYVLSPYAALYMAKIYEFEPFKEVCKLSKRAAEIRFFKYMRWYENNPLNNSSFKDEYDLKIAKLFAKEKTCSLCRTVTKPKNTFCHVCGNDNFFIGRTKYMIYPSIDIDQFNRPLKCPRCNNEQITGDYCMICGAYLINECTESRNACNIEKPLPPNARYCPHCGNPSTYLANNFLPHWNTLQQDESSDNDLPF